MKLVAFVLLLLPLLAFGMGKNVTLSGGNALGTSFSASGAGIANPLAADSCVGKNTIEILNQTAQIIGWGMSTTASVAPPETHSFIPSGPNSGHRYHIEPGVLQYLWLYSTNGSLTSGSYQASCWNE